jgi:GTP-binding protein Era
MNSQYAQNKSGFVAVMGRPNVGKSTLINALIGQKIAAVSPRPQTTRKRQMGILTFQHDDLSCQIVFVDTPGIHKPLHRLGEMMNLEAIQTLEECDIILFVSDVSQLPTDEDDLLFDLMHQLKVRRPVILALNKIDLVNDDQAETNMATFFSKAPTATPCLISAASKQNLDQLLKLIVERLPEGSHFFPDDQTTDLYERELAADLIREAALNLLREEVPHGIAIRIDQFIERNEQGAYIEATIFLERGSHKPIVIGKDGRMLKKIGTASRKEIESMSGRKVFLQLNVKVRKNWRDDEKVLRQFGY